MTSPLLAFISTRLSGLPRYAFILFYILPRYAFILFYILRASLLRYAFALRFRATLIFLWVYSRYAYLLMVLLELRLWLSRYAYPHLISTSSYILLDLHVMVNHTILPTPALRFIPTPALRFHHTILPTPALRFRFTCNG